MTLKQNLVKINLPGGMVSAGDLYRILEAAEKAGVEHVRFGNRQQVIFYVEEDLLPVLKQDLMAADIMFELDADIHPNIISSYAIEEVFYHADWLREGVYKDILDLFDYRPQLKINLVDNDQTFFPFFTGNLNYIASDTSNYWYLYIRFPKTNIIYAWPSLVYSEDISSLSSAIESTIFANKELFYDQPSVEGNVLHGLVTASGNFVVQPMIKALQLPDFKLPYYEGFNRYGNKLWLGIYRRNELFSVAFLMDVCRICLKTRVGQLYTTPWKSVIVKGIELSDRDLWDVVLCKHRINVRHASNELNWQVEDLCDYGLDLKNYLVRIFNEEDVRTYKLCFAIKTQPKTGLFGSIIIKTLNKDVQTAASGTDFYDVLYTREFNPNSKDYVCFREEVTRQELSMALVELCNFYYDKQCGLALAALPLEKEAAREQKQNETYLVYQCKSCLTIYDDRYGDDQGRIPTGASFASLSIYNCPTCDAPKEDFVPLTIPVQSDPIA